jgi:hypothetical protein
MATSAANAAVVVFLNTEGQAALLGLGIAFIMLFVGAALSWLLLVAFYPGFGDAVAFTLASDNNENESKTLFIVWLPAISYLLGAVSTFSQADKNLIDSLRNLLTSDLIRFLVLLLIGLFIGAVWLPFHNVVIRETGELYTCTVYPVIGLVLEFANAGTLIAAVLSPIWNLLYGPWHVILGKTLILRVLIDCQISQGGQNTFQTVLAIAETFAQGVLQIVFAITDWLANPDRFTSPVFFAPGLTTLLSIFNIVAGLFDCVCEYLSAYWVQFFLVPQSVSVVNALDCLFNIPFALVGSGVLAIQKREVPQINATVTYIQCTLNNAASFGEEVNLFLFDSFSLFLTQILNVTIAENGPTLTLPHFGGRKRQAPPSQQAQIMQLLLTAGNNNNLYTTAGFQPPNVVNVTNVTVYLNYWRGVLETPYLHTISFAISGALSLVNGTWSLTQLITYPVTNFSLVQYFQINFVIDWEAEAGYALGAFLGSFTTISAFGNFLGGLIELFLRAFQIAIELLVTFFFWAFFFPPQESQALNSAGLAFYDSLSIYCSLDNTTQAFRSYQLALNNSAELAITFGCNASSSLVPLDSPLATCFDSVGGALAMHIYRFPLEVVTYGELLICNLPMLLQFVPPTKYTPPPNANMATNITTGLGYSNPIMLNTANMSLNGMARELINLGTSLQNLFYLFDTLINGTLGSPPGVPCQYPDPTSPIGIGFKVSPFCTFGNLIDTILLAAGSAVYEILQNVNFALGAIAFPALAPDIQIPTFSSTIQDLELIGCQLGKLLALLLPVTFSCSAQLGVPPNKFSPSLLGPVQQYPFLPPVSNVTQRTVGNQPCTHTVVDWAAQADNTTCNCSAITTYFQAGAVSGGCILFCLNPGVGYEMGFGTNVSIPAPCNGFLTATLFTNRSTLQTFLGSQFPAISGFNPNITIDPTNLTTYGPNGFMQELVASWLNDYYNRIFMPQYVVQIDFTNATCTQVLTGNATVDLAFLTLFTDLEVFGVPRMKMYDFIAVLNLFFYGDAQDNNVWNFMVTPFCYFEQVANTTQVPYITASFAFANFIADSINGTGAGQWPAYAEGFRQILSRFNGAFTGCAATPAYSTCFPRLLVPSVAAPFPGPAPNITVPSDPSTICTFGFDDVFNGNTGACQLSGCPNVTNFAAFYTPFHAGCLMLCDPMPYPQLLGGRFDHCVEPGNCNVNGYELDGFNQSLGFMNIYFNMSVIGPFFGNTPSSGDASPQEFASMLQLALYDVYWQQRYRPGFFMYVRPMTDPLFFSSCFNDTIADILFNGWEVNIVVQVLNDVWIGGINNPLQCNAFYPHGSLHNALCSNIMLYLGQNITLPLWATNVTAHIFPFLNAFFLSQAGCTMSSTCFYTSTFDVGSIRGFSVGAPVSNFQWTNPQFFVAIPNTPIQQITPCGDTIQCFSETTCSGGSLLFVPLVFFSSVFGEINMAIKNGFSALGFGIGFFDILNSVIAALVTQLTTFVVYAASALDCLICAISGNVVGSIECRDLNFFTFKPIMVFIQSALILIARVVVDLASLFVNFWYAIASGQLNLFFQSFVAVLNDVGGLLLAFGTSLGFIILGAMDLCKVLGITNPQCVDQVGGAAKLGAKRALTHYSYALDAANYEKRVIAATQPTPAPSNATLPALFTLFAPGWLVAPYSYMWNVADPCNASMTHYAVQVMQGRAAFLTEMENDTIAYCLSFDVLFANLTAQSTAYDAPGLLNECIYLMRDLSLNKHDFSSLPVQTRMSILKCISAYGSMYAHQQAAQGALDWLPSNFYISNVLHPHNIMYGLQVLGEGIAVSSHQYNDYTLSDAALTSTEYNNNLLAVYGSDRLELARYAHRTGEVASLATYADAMLNDAPLGTQKRQTAAPVAVAPEHKKRVVGMSVFISTLRDIVLPAMPNAFIAAADSHVMTSLPPTYARVTLPSGIQVNSPTTQAYLAESRDPPGDTLNLTRTVRTTTGRLVASAYGAFRTFWTGLASDGSQASTPRPPNFGAMTRKRGTSPAPSTLKKIATTPLVLARAIKALWTATSEIVSGRAWLNATGTFNGRKAPTAFKWQTHGGTPPETSANTPSLWDRGAHRARQIFGDNAFYTVLHRRAQRAAVHEQMARSDMTGAETTRRLQVVMDTIAISYARTMGLPQPLSYAAAASPSNISNGTLPPDPSLCFNVTGGDLCTQCFFLDQTVGYLSLFGNQTVFYFNNTNPQVAATVNYSLAGFDFYANYFFNESIPAQVGDSPNNPVRWPNMNISTWYHYLNDRVPNKIGFSDWQPLINATAAFFHTLFANANLFDINTYLPQGSPNNFFLKRGLQDGQQARPALGPEHGIPRPMLAGYSTADMLFYNIKSVSSVFASADYPQGQTISIWDIRIADSNSSTANYTTFSQIAFGWVDLIWTTFIFCSFSYELTGEKARYSLAQITVVGAGVIIAYYALIAAVPMIGFPINALLGILWMFIGDLVYLIWNVMMTLFVFALITGVATGFKFSCLFCTSLVFWTMGMDFLAINLFTKAPVWGFGLVNEPWYVNSNASICSYWQTNQWTVPNCASLGWTSWLDVPVFILHVYDPTLLTYIENPSNFFYPLSSFIASPATQTALHRWDNVNIYANPVIYSQQLTCLWGVEVIPWLVLILIIGYLLTFGPFYQLLALLFWLAAVLMGALFFFMFGFFVTLYFMLTAPGRLDEYREKKRLEAALERRMGG